MGEPFESFAPKFVNRIKVPSALSGVVLEQLRVTRGRRTPYDQVMLELHDRGKADVGYQKASPKTAVAFPPGTTWIVYTDRVMHAALGGQHLLEQTFHLPVAAMRHPERSPLRVSRVRIGARWCSQRSPANGPVWGAGLEHRLPTFGRVARR